MGKPKSVPVPDPEQDRKSRGRSGSQPQEPLSGSKKTKQHNHVSHHNPEG
ncbi:small acid-soluble spore protein P [Paenibacillus protaetiae]|uniref:Small acid-soluble spore protein P n=1 Tax=Paenibacillus protaetiae TaxID=2509456 RepID=A0A4P6EZZ9_9BACL|nr:small acid-soluble spore protein P [Paenibacillus protaetiae]QAY67399.1 small acid-soluble spore protein P [Paenibacillus protaetiae]